MIYGRSNTTLTRSDIEMLINKFSLRQVQAESFENFSLMRFAMSALFMCEVHPIPVALIPVEMNPLPLDHFSS